MKRLKFLVLVLGVVMVGCTALPRNQQEAFPLRNMDPGYGIIEVRGTAPVNLYLYDQHEQLISQQILKGQGRVYKQNGRYLSKLYTMRLPVGVYSIRIVPFYYMNVPYSGIFNLVTFQWKHAFECPGGSDTLAHFGVIQWCRYRYDLRDRAYTVFVNRDPTDCYYNGRHFGWCARISGGSIPKNAHGGPLMEIDLRGNFSRR